MKVDEIDNVLNYDILFALEKLRKERAQYMQWTSGNAQLQRLKCFCIAYQYTTADQVKNSALSKISDCKAKITEFQEEYLKIEVGVTEIEGSIAVITKEKEKQMNNDFKALSETVDKLFKDLVKVRSAVNNEKDSLKVEKAVVAKSQKTLNELKKGVAERDDDVCQFEADTYAFTLKVDSLTKSLAEREADY